MSDSLAAIYAEIPAIRCKRKCFEACGPVVQLGALAPAEARRLTMFEQIEGPGAECTMLDHGSKLCRVYAMRPLICRLWGVVDSPLMRCPFGCVPERWLTDEESRALLARVQAL